MADEIVVLEIDRRDDTTYNHVDRLAVHRHGAGLQVTEVAEPVVAAQREVAGRSPSRRSVALERENPLSVFSTPQLQAVGLTSDAIAEIRTMAPTIEIGEALAELGVDAEVIELVADMWHDQERYLAIFDERTSADERGRPHRRRRKLAERLAHADSTTRSPSSAHETSSSCSKGSIEEWMFYLHPSQTRHRPPRLERAVAGAGWPGDRQDGGRAASRAPPRRMRAGGVACS